MNQMYLTELLSIIQAKNNNQDLQAFLEAILTPKELEEIPKRLQIVKMLKAGVSQREIAEKLGVGIATVTRGSKELKKGNFKEV